MFRIFVSPENLEIKNHDQSFTSLTENATNFYGQGFLAKLRRIKVANFEARGFQHISTVDAPTSGQYLFRNLKKAPANKNIRT